MAKDRREYYKEYNKKHGDRHKKGYYRNLLEDRHTLKGLIVDLQRAM